MTNDFREKSETIINEYEEIIMDDDEQKKIYKNLAILYAIAFVALLVYLIVMMVEFLKFAGGVS